jgi:hypothetical protein
MDIPLPTPGNRTHIPSGKHTPAFGGNSIRPRQFIRGYGLTVSMVFPMTWPCACQSVGTVRRLGDPSGARNLGV